MIDLARTGEIEIRISLHACVADTFQCRLEFGIDDEKSVMPAMDVAPFGEVDDHTVAGAHGDEVAPFRAGFEAEDAGQEPRRGPFVARRNNQMVELHRHTGLLDRECSERRGLGSNWRCDLRLSTRISR